MVGFFFFNKQKKCIISVCAKKQHREASTKHCILGRAHGGQFPHGVTLLLHPEKQGREIKLKAYLSASVVPGYRNL